MNRASAESVTDLTQLECTDLTNLGLVRPIWRCATGSRHNTEVKQRRARLVLG